MGLQFGIFDHIEPVPGLSLQQIYRERLLQLERYDAAGFYAYHLAEHHTPAVHSLAPSQNVFLAAASQRTECLRLAPCVYVLPLHHPLRLIEEVCMLDHLSNGRLELGIGRGGVLEAYFWGSDADVDRNYVKYQETLDILRQGLSHEELTYQGEFYTFDALPMRLHPQQQPYPPLWYMRNAEIAAQEGMHAILVGTLDGFEANVQRYYALWEEHQGTGALTVQGTAPKIGLVNHIVLADTDQEAVAAARPAWDEYVWNLMTPRRIEAERRGLTQFLGANRFTRPSGYQIVRPRVHSSPSASAPRKSSGAELLLAASAVMDRVPGSALWPVRRTPCAYTWTSMLPPGQITSSVPSNGVA